ncbi:iron chaperone [Arundinibacter roseus]|uniref:DUF1801 domain-containing protein n=1 Tax=Arundinibacter roseus TaxID=2070510 RepID=A0A4R4K6U2_9BACT|nr:DUF1801 domain-containing protein [Arundinibacter roseus]TDB62266.1 DUF1801 domain-containing protein [Arundinibacter roseus]
MNSVDEYISSFAPDIQSRLATLRQLFFEILPHTEESIRYNMPAYTVGKFHLYFAAYKNHIGFYPIYGLPKLEEEIAPYKAKKTKDSLHFLHNEPLPLDLIRKIIVSKSKD